MGALLSVDLTNITDANGLPTDAADFTYEWVRVDGANEIELGGATGSTYTPVAADTDKTLKVRVSFTDLDGFEEGPLTSATTAQVAVPGVTLSPSPLTVIEGGNADYTVVLDTEPTAGVTIEIGGHSGTDVTLSGSTLSAGNALTFTTVNWSTPQTVTVSAAEDGDAAHDTVTLTHTVAAGSAPEYLSLPAVDVAVTVNDNDVPGNSAATGAPNISGTAQVGETLAADTSGIADEDGLANATFAYQWLAGGSDIAGATGSTYTLTSGEQGQTVKVRVSFTDDANNEESLTSEPTVAVAGQPPAPLTAMIENAPETHDGSSEFTFELRFSEEVKLSYKTLRDQSFTVSGGTVKKAKRLEQGSNILWLITVEPDSDAGVTVVLPATTDCDDPGAICTEDGRLLSKRLELTVSGPGG